MNVRRRALTAAVVLGLCAASAGLAVAAVGAVADPAAPTVPSPITDRDLAAARSVAAPTTTFVPVGACRIADTSLAGGRLRAGHSRDFRVAGALLRLQGGPIAGCHIPAAARAVTGRVSAIDVAHGGRLAISSSRRTSRDAALFFRTGQAATTGFTQAVDPGGRRTLRVTMLAGSADVAIDVTGYYIDQIQALVYIGTPTKHGRVYSGGTGITGVRWTQPGQATVTVDRDVTNCSPSATAFAGVNYYANAQTLHGRSVLVYFWVIDPTTHLPTYVDGGYLYLTITC